MVDNSIFSDLVGNQGANTRAGRREENQGTSWPEAKAELREAPISTGNPVSPRHELQANTATDLDYFPRGCGGFQA